MKSTTTIWAAADRKYLHKVCINEIFGRFFFLLSLNRRFACIFFFIVFRCTLNWKCFHISHFQFFSFFPHFLALTCIPFRKCTLHANGYDCNYQSKKLYYGIQLKKPHWWHCNHYIRLEKAVADRCLQFFFPGNLTILSC